MIREPLEPELSAMLRSLGRQQLDKGNPLRFRALGSSMRPFIRGGDILHVVPADRYAIGDILLCELGEQWLAHRLVERRQRSDGTVELILRGDAHADRDKPLTTADVLGRVLAVERGGRSWSTDGAWGRLARRTAELSVLGQPVLPRVRWAWLSAKALARRLVSRRR